MASMPVIADRGEFIDVLNLLRKGRLLVRSDHDTGRCLIEGGVVYTAYDTLAAYGLIEELPPPPGRDCFAPHLHWYRLSPRGQDFAERAWAEWRARPLWQRCWLRMTG
jgi:DNA-binding PadR family transcriptional regulator